MYTRTSVSYDFFVIVPAVTIIIMLAMFAALSTPLLCYFWWFYRSVTIHYVSLMFNATRRL